MLTAVIATTALLALLAMAWPIFPVAPAGTAVDLRQQSEAQRLELENRLRLADRVLRAIAADIMANGRDSAPLGEAEQRYFDTVTFMRSGEAPIQMLPVVGTVPVVDAPWQERLAQGDSIVVSGAGSGNQPARISLVREVAAPGYRSALLAAELTPTYLWAAPGGAMGAPARCVRESGGTTLHCSTAAAWQASNALRSDLSGAIERLDWSAGSQAWQGAAAVLTLASPHIPGHWTVLSLAMPTPGADRVGVSRRTVLTMSGALALAALVVFLLLRRRKAQVDTRQLAQATRSALAGPPALPPPDDETALQHRLERQRHAIRAMTEIDRASLSRAGIERLVELASTHLLLCTGAQALTIAVLDPDGLQRITVTHTFADDAEAPVPEQDVMDASVQELLRAPTDGGWIHQLGDLALLQAMAQRIASSAFVLPVHCDGQPAGLIVLGCHDPALIGADETSNARAVAGRLGAALTSLARERELYAQTHFDDTTALPNRQYLQEHLPQHISRARRDKSRMALLFVDLDGFKKINRVAGHSRGDLVLKDTATRIRETLREEDLVVRFGGDEFVVVLPKVGTGLEARRVADKLLVALARPFLVDGEEHQLGASIGISIYPDDAQTVDAMLHNADSAMFDAKSAGRGRYSFFDAAVNRAAIDRSSLELQLRRAIAQSEFVVFYQPQIDLRSGQIDGAEALVRWNHPSRGMIGPADFISIAEQAGLIEQIGEQVMLAACLQLRQWDTLGIAPRRVSVNVSSLEVTRGDIVGRVERILSATGLRPMHLELELTEGVFLEEASGALEKLNELRRRGVRIAIDDFGTGYSSLGYLRRLPIDVVKIDQSFVRDLTSSRDGNSIVRAVLDVAHSLGKQVVAEGVETEQHRSQLTDMGCDVGQGYLWSQPLPAEQFEMFYRQWQLVSRPVALEPS